MLCDFSACKAAVGWRPPKRTYLWRMSERARASAPCTYSCWKWTSFSFCRRPVSSLPSYCRSSRWSGSSCGGNCYSYVAYSSCSCCCLRLWLMATAWYCQSNHRLSRRSCPCYYGLWWTCYLPSSSPFGGLEVSSGPWLAASSSSKCAISCSAYQQDRSQHQAHLSACYTGRVSRGSWSCEHPLIVASLRIAA